MAKNITKDISDTIEHHTTLGRKILNFRVNSWHDFIDNYLAGEKVDATYTKSFKATPKLFNIEVKEDPTMLKTMLFLDLDDGSRFMLPEAIVGQKIATAEPVAKEKKGGRKKKV